MTDDLDDVPSITADQMKRARPMRQTHSEEALAPFRRGPGRPPSDSPKERVSLRLDRDVIDALRQSGSGWQSRVNDILRAATRPTRP